MGIDKNPERSLKSLNFKWHIALASADAIVLGLFVAPELLGSATATQLGLYRALTVTLAPVLLLLLMNLFSSNMKAMLVFWKPLGVLPACEAFTRHGPADPRVDMAQLKKNVGVLPTEPRDQNAKWYKLYKQVELRTEVAAAQKDFLMYRDMAVLSLLLVAICPIGMMAVGADVSVILGSVALFLVQYVVTAINARQTGERFVSNVLAIHATTKVAATKAVAA